MAFLQTYDAGHLLANVSALRIGAISVAARPKEHQIHKALRL